MRLFYFPGPLPTLRVDAQDGSAARCQVDEAAMMADFAVAKQPGQHSQGVLCDGRVDEGFLPLQSLNRAATWFSIVFETRINDLRVKFGCRTQV